MMAPAGVSWERVVPAGARWMMSDGSEVRIRYSQLGRVTLVGVTLSAHVLMNLGPFGVEVEQFAHLLATARAEARDLASVEVGLTISRRRNQSTIEVLDQIAAEGELLSACEAFFRKETEPEQGIAVLSCSTPVPSIADGLELDVAWH